MKLTLGLLFTFNLSAAFASGVSWTSIRACYQGYDVQMMSGWANQNYVTKYIMSIRGESYNSLQNQINQNMMLTDKQVQELKQFEVTTTPNYDKFETELSFGKVRALVLNGGTNVELKIYDSSNRELASYYYSHCY